MGGPDSAAKYVLPTIVHVLDISITLANINEHATHCTRDHKGKEKVKIAIV